MIGPFLLLTAQAAATSAPDTAAPAAQPFCVRAAGSEIIVCGVPQQQQQPGVYRLPRLPTQAYGPPLPGAQANLGHGIRATLRGQASNSSRARRNRSGATLSVPF